MSLNPALLDTPIDWRDPRFAGMLGQLQGNILKGHGREVTQNIFLSFDGATQNDVRMMIRAIGARVTSAITQLTEVETFKMFGRPGGTAVFFFLTAAGYDWLGIAPPEDPAFRAGMAARRDSLRDPERNRWFGHWQGAVPHAMLLIGDETASQVGNAAAAFDRLFATAGVRVTGVDGGTALRRPIDGDPTAKGPGIEHFGYIDGRSQPLMLADEVGEEARRGGIDKFDPGVGPGKLALVPDPHGGADAFGSYLVYRRLEQNVRGFKEREGGFEFPGMPQNLATTLRLADRRPTGPNERERAGAFVVGRFEDGTPVTNENAEVDADPPANNFNYDHDPDGNRCPFHAHIRKTNPRRGETERLMPRRGIPFGQREDGSFDDPRTMPTGNVGLLFMAYNQDIERQFEFVQDVWANNADFPNGGDGIDPVIGQTSPATAPQDVDPTQSWPDPWDGGGRTAFPFGGFVRMTGGEYFFAPSIGFLRTV